MAKKKHTLTKSEVAEINKVVDAFFAELEIDETVVLLIGDEMTAEKTPSTTKIDDDTTGLWAIKRARQAKDYEDVRSGKRTAQSMHLFGRELAQKCVVTYKDVDFD